MSGDSTAVLDLLFDQCDGVLKEEAPAIQSLDFSTLGLFNELDDFLFDDAILQPDPKQQTTTYTDHDYVMQPAQSPSVTVVSPWSPGHHLRDYQIMRTNFVQILT